MRLVIHPPLFRIVASKERLRSLAPSLGTKSLLAVSVSQEIVLSASALTDCRRRPGAVFRPLMPARKRSSPKKEGPRGVADVRNPLQSRRSNARPASGVALPRMRTASRDYLGLSNTSATRKPSWSTKRPCARIAGRRASSAYRQPVNSIGRCPSLRASSGVCPIPASRWLSMSA